MSSTTPWWEESLREFREEAKLADEIIREVFLEEDAKMVKLYKVGGCVRDAILGVQSKDIDYAVEARSFEVMEFYIAQRGKIFLSKPEYQTIRAMIDGEAADFVLCRKDGSYSDGRRPDTVQRGTIYDDLARRDFTMNAIAQREDGSLLDPHGGQYDLRLGLIRTVGDPRERFSEDSLRILRAIRFAITKGMAIASEIQYCFEDPIIVNQLKFVSTERIREEMYKCFKHDTALTLQTLWKYPLVLASIFNDSTPLWLSPTMEKR